MEAQDSLSFETEGDKQIYKYVERHGTATRNAARKESALGPDEFRERLDYLTTRGYLDEEGGTLSLGLDIGSIENYETAVFDYTIRPGRNDDFEGLVGAIREVTSDENYVIAESVAEELLYEDTVNRHNTVESRMFFVATVDNEIVGWTHLDLPQVDKLRNTARQTVGVKPPYRSQGVGSQLLQRGIDWAGANGYRKLHNNVPATNEHALAFLEDHGWVTEGIRKQHYTLGDDLVDEVMMAYEIHGD